MSGRHFGFAIATDAGLLGAGASHGHGVNGFEVAGVRHQVNADLAAVSSGEYAGGADVILHVSAAEHAAGIDVFEAGKNLGCGTTDDVDDDVQASAMAHGEHGLLGAVLGGGVQNFVEQRDQRGVAFERITLGADVARVNRLLEDVGADELIEHARRGRRARAVRTPCAPGSSGGARDRECA